MKETYLIFDMDGTLTESGEGVMNAGAYSLGMLGLPVPPEDDLRSIVGPPLTGSFLRFGVPEARVDEAIVHYRKYYAEKGKFEARLYEGIPGLLKRLRKAGYTLCVGTSKPEGLAREILERFGALGEFRCVAGATMTHERETKTAVLEYLFDTVGRPERALMIGDTDCDVKGAKDMGIGCVAVSWGYGNREATLAAGPIAPADTPEELERILLRELPPDPAVTETEIVRALRAMGEPDYAAFTAKLNPGIDPELILGVRVPKLRAFAKQLTREQREAFLNALPHLYYEENLLHAILIGGIKDPAACARETERFAPYIDCWSVCDAVDPKALARDPETLLGLCRGFVCSPGVYIRRLGVDLLQRCGPDAQFTPEMNKLAAAAANGSYYADMAVAWYFATALAKRWSETLPILTENLLPVWVHNKTVQKAIESYRITEEQKALLRGLKR